MLSQGWLTIDAQTEDRLRLRPQRSSLSEEEYYWTLVKLAPPLQNNKFSGERTCIIRFEKKNCPRIKQKDSNSCLKRLSWNGTMRKVAYFWLCWHVRVFCHLVDMSDFFVILSDLYADLSDKYVYLSFIDLLQNKS